MRIDAREVPEQNRKTYIFQKLNELDFGEKLSIVNSHDISPLLRLINRESPGIFNWEYINKGPAEWEIVIGKKPANIFTIEEIIEINPSSIFILHKYGIEFYIHYNDTLSNLLLNKREQLENVINEAINYKSEVFNFIRPGLWSPEFIIDYVLENHHAYLAMKLPEIEKTISHIEHNFGSGFPQIQRLKDRFTQFMDEMTDHLDEEEKIIFPSLKKNINKILSAEKKKELIMEEINWMKEDHFLTGDNMKAIRKICNNFISVEADLPGLNLVYQELRELENDFLLHILFENHFLTKSIQKRLV